MKTHWTDLRRSQIPCFHAFFYLRYSKNMGVFPDGFGDLGGLAFADVFENHPKWVEFADSAWTDNCTGLLSDFLDYVRVQLKDSDKKAAHEKRCIEYCTAATNIDTLPHYMLKYIITPPPLRRRNSSGDECDH